MARAEGREEELEEEAAAAADEEEAEEDEDEEAEAALLFSNAAFLAAGAYTAAAPPSPSAPPPLLSRARFGAPAADDADAALPAAPPASGVLLVLDEEAKNAESLGCVMTLCLCHRKVRRVRARPWKAQKEMKVSEEEASREVDPPHPHFRHTDPICTRHIPSKTKFLARNLLSYTAYRDDVWVVWRPRHAPGAKECCVPFLRPVRGTGARCDPQVGNHQTETTDCWAHYGILMHAICCIRLGRSVASGIASFTRDFGADRGNGQRPEKLGKSVRPNNKPWPLLRTFGHLIFAQGKKIDLQRYAG